MVFIDRKCPTCDGSGLVFRKNAKWGNACPRCNGMGSIGVGRHDGMAGDRLLSAVARLNQDGGNSSMQSVMYFPPKTPSASICFGVRSGENSG